MIKASEAIRVARSMLGTPYGSDPGQLDCINLIKYIIRNAEGGDKKYTDAHVPALWLSYIASGKYRHLTYQQIGVDGALPGQLAFKGEPLGRDRQPSHVGIVSGNGKVIHASSAEGMVVETDLHNGQWTLIGTSSMIVPETDHDPEPDQRSYSAQVIAVKNDKPVNLRTGPSTSDTVITKVPVGTMVDVLVDLDGWCYIDTGREQGYMSSTYLQKCDSEPVPDPDVPDPDTPESEWMDDPTIVNESGAVIHLDGRWRVAID